jgi:hypothetical protein
MKSTWLAMPEDFGSIELRDEAEWLDACGAVYEAAAIRVAGAREPLSILFVPFTGRAGVAQGGQAYWLHATSLDDAVERYMRGERAGHSRRTPPD